MENLTGGTPPVRYLPCVVPCKLYFGNALEFQLSEMIYLLMQIREIMREVDEKQKGDDLVKERIKKLALAVSNIE